MSLADTRFSDRRRALAAELAGQRIDAVLVTNLLHVRYLTNYSGSNGALLLRKDLRADIATDGRYATRIRQEVPDIEPIITRTLTRDLLATLDGGDYWRVGIEADYLSYNEYQRLSESAPERVTLVPISGVVENGRLVKDEYELGVLEKVAGITNEAFDELVAAGGIRAGRSEREVAADLEYRMRVKGSDGESFDTICASGPNSSQPHYGVGDRVMQNGDLVTLDFGAVIDGYNSDMTRTVAIGEPGEKARDIYEVVYRAQLAGVAAAVPGTALADVDAACRDIITEAGYGDYFVHSTGHGVGIDVHEGPSAARTGRGELHPGMTLTIEPGIYLPGECGVRIEDTLIITDGAPKIITPTSKELRVL